MRRPRVWHVGLEMVSESEKDVKLRPHPLSVKNLLLHWIQKESEVSVNLQACAKKKKRKSMVRTRARGIICGIMVIISVN